MTTRQRVENAITDWAGVDAALLEIGRLNRRVEAAEATQQETIARAKEACIAATTLLLRKRVLLELQMEIFAAGHRKEIPGKTRKANFGEVGFRKSTKLLIEDEDLCVEALEREGLEACVEIKKVPNKNQLKKLDDATLEKVGARRESEETFGYKVYQERVVAVEEAA